MYDVFISAMPICVWVLAALNLLLTVLLFKSYGKNKHNKLPFLMGLVAFGLFYDALIIALGTVVKEGGLLKALSQVRFALHGFLIPLIIPISAMAMRLKPKMLKTVWLVTLILMLVGLVSGFCVNTEARTIGGVTRYASSAATPGWADGVQNALSYVTVFLIIIAGAIVFFKEKNPHFFLAGFFMLAFTLLGIFLGKSPDGDKAKSLMFFISMFGEVLMAAFFFLFHKKRAKDDRRINEK
ncbi:MAG: hypothetical protein II668_08615 [Oscillospiraceae bacterium]|nr:hypothetical protein [Oscillospiraceae bacterium]